MRPTSSTLRATRSSSRPAARRWPSASCRTVVFAGSTTTGVQTANVSRTVRPPPQGYASIAASATAWIARMRSREVRSRNRRFRATTSAPSVAVNRSRCARLAPSRSRIVADGTRRTISRSAASKSGCSFFECCRHVNSGPPFSPGSTSISCKRSLLLRRGGAGARATPMVRESKSASCSAYRCAPSPRWSSSSPVVSRTTHPRGVKSVSKSTEDAK
mmetsp:Transcript_918/g.3648  ORF Transcript_918/g.3648 Transcript_918/m.3648 type:complete len:217 (+) Transcript_918:311-961(+)